MAYREFTGTLDAPSTGKFREFNGALDAPQPAPASPFEKALGSAYGRMQLGMVTPALGIGQLGAHAVDAVAGTDYGKHVDETIRKIDAAKKRGMVAHGHDPESTDWMGMLGFGVPGTGISQGVAKILPAVTGPFGRAGVAAIQSGAIGASAPTKGEDFGREKTGQAVTSVALGGLSSLGSDVVRGAANIVRDAWRPLTEKGRSAILDLLQRAKVPENARGRVAEALRHNIELVPGSKPTAGELMAHLDDATALASHQAVLERMSYPVATAPEFAQRFGENAKARLGLIQSFAKTPADLEAALESRDKLAQQLYGQVYKQSVPPDAAFHALRQRPSMHDALRIAGKSAAERGQTFPAPGPLQRLQVRSAVTQPMEPGPVTGLKITTHTGDPLTTGLRAQEMRDAEGRLIGMTVGKTSRGTEAPLEGLVGKAVSRGQARPGDLEGIQTHVMSRGQDVPGTLERLVMNIKETRGKDGPMSGEDLQRVKQAMDDAISNPERFGLGATQVREIASTRNSLIEWMKHNLPGYESARATYQAQSIAPNQMQIGQVLEEALRSPLGTKERSTVFANALANAPKTIKKATGQAVTDDLSRVLTPDNMQKVNAVKADLARYDQYLNLARKSSGGGRDAFPGNVEVSLPNILSRPAMITNYIMKKIGEGAEDEIAKEAARRYLHDPAAIARALTRDPNAAGTYQQIIDALLRQSPVAAGVAGGQVGR